MFWKRLGAGLLAVWMLTGCDRGAVVVQPTTAEPSTAPTTVTSDPATTGASTKPVTTAPSLTITIEGATNEFPNALLRLDEADDKIVALLYTNDPEEALKDDYDGNSFYFELPLDIATAAEIETATYDFKATTSEKSDSPEGIFLIGRRWHLQLDDVRIDFRPTSDAAANGALPASVKVRVVGTFRMFDTTSERTTSSLVPVSGEFIAKIHSRPQ